jgi:hypothetical protein
MFKIVKNPGNGRLNNLNDLFLNVLNTKMKILVCFNKRIKCSLHCFSLKPVPLSGIPTLFLTAQNPSTTTHILHGRILL